MRKSRRQRPVVPLFLGVLGISALGVLLLNRGPHFATEIRSEQQDSEFRWAREPVPSLASRTLPPSKSTGVLGVEVVDGTASKSVTFRGRVVSDLDESPIAAGLVFLVKKAWRGAYSSADVPTTSTSKDGSFVLTALDASESWIGVVAEGHRRDYRDCETAGVSGEKRIEFRLKRGALVRVETSLQAGDELGQSTLVRFDSASGSRGWLLPAPGEPGDVRMVRELPRNGPLAAWVASDGPIDVRAERFGYRCDPAVITLPATGGTARFEFVASAGIRLQVVDEATGLPLTSSVRMDVSNAATGLLINGAVFQSPYGEFTLQDRLPSATCFVTVQVAGRIPWKSPAIHLDEPGRRYDVVARLREDRTLTVLRLRFPAVHDLLVSRAWRAAPRPISLVRWHVSPYQIAPAGQWMYFDHAEWDEVSGVLTVRLPAGVSGTVLFWIPKLEQCGWMDLTSLQAGATVETSIPLTKGIRATLPPVWSPDHQELLDVRLVDKSGVLGELPLIRIRGESSSLIGDVKRIPGALVLGPYPADRLRVRALYADATTSETELTSEEAPDPAGQAARPLPK